MNYVETLKRVILELSMTEITFSIRQQTHKVTPESSMSCVVTTKMVGYIDGSDFMIRLVNRIKWTDDLVVDKHATYVYSVAYALNILISKINSLYDQKDFCDLISKLSRSIGMNYHDLAARFSDRQVEIVLRLCEFMTDLFDRDGGDARDKVVGENRNHIINGYRLLLSQIKSIYEK